MFQTVHLECHQQVFLHPENAPKLLATPLGDHTALTILDRLAELRGLLLRRGEGTEVERRGGEGGTSDPHNVGNRLMPLNVTRMSYRVLTLYCNHAARHVVS